MSDPVDSLGMPLRGTSTALHFNGNYTQLVNFLESVERLAQPLSLSDKDTIKYALKYSAPKQRQLFQYFEGDNYEEFANYVLEFDLECGVDHYTCPIIKIPAAPEAPLEAPSLSAPQLPEPTPSAAAAAVIAPQSEICNTILIPDLPEAPLDEITSLPVHIKAPNIGASPEPLSDPEYPLAAAIPPQSEICNPNFVQVPLEAPNDKIPPEPVQDDHKHPSLISAPIQAPPRAPEAYYATLLGQSLSQKPPLDTDNSALCTFSAYSDYQLPVKHPCIASPKCQLYDISEDPQALPARHFAPAHAQISLVETPYTRLHLWPHFSSLLCLRPSISQAPVAALFLKDCQATQDYGFDEAPAPPSRFQSHFNIFNFCDFRTLPLYHDFGLVPAAFILPLSSHQLTINLASMHCVCTPRALILALYEPIIAEESPHYRIFTISSVFSHNSLIQHQPHFNQVSMRDLCARLAHIFTPCTFILVFNFALCALSCTFRTFAYHANLIRISPTKGYLFWSWRLLGLNLESMRRTRATFAPNFASYLSFTNIYTVNQRPLTCGEGIIKIAQKRPKSHSACTPHHVVEPLCNTLIASPWCALNLRRSIQEFILPVTSPPSCKK
ncbi:hypothetical protein F4604DRAFT_1950744 [Suillus subluteus]|nr:hypothetical protein F4604DRAFT_1950744 [Suillus subluteus]